MLGTPPSVRSPKVRKDKTACALKPTPGANKEDVRLRWYSGGKPKIREDRAIQASWRGVSSGPVAFVEQDEEDRMEMRARLSCSALMLH